MRTKFIKVSTSDRLPEKDGDYYVKMRHLSDLQLYYYLDPLHDKEYMNKHVEYWLDEVPDYEEEMKEMINELILELNPATTCGDYQEVISKANSLLTKLKES